MSETPQSVSEYLAEIGGRGGLARTDAKKQAGKANAKKAREAKAAKRLRPLTAKDLPQVDKALAEVWDSKPRQKPPFAEDRESAVWTDKPRRKAPVASWDRAVSLREVKEAATRQKAAGRDSEASGSGLRIQTTGRKR
jgi:hypothetical protein